MENRFEHPDVLAAWDWGGQVAGALPYGEGHINATHCIYVQLPDGDSRRYILQKINTATFTDPDGLMENICGVTEYLRQQAVERGTDPSRVTLQVIPTIEGKPYFRDAQDGCWRVYTFVEDTVCLQQVKPPEDFYQSAVAFGNFQKQLAGYPAATLHETIPHFHDTPRRFENFEKALAADVLGRAKDVAAEIEFVRARKADCAVMTDLLAEGDSLVALLGDLAITQADAVELLRDLPAGLDPERRAVVETACKLVGKVNYFWGGKSLTIGWNDAWGTLRQVTAAGSSTTGTYRPYGMDCSGLVDWVFYNVSGGEYIIGHGGGAHAQHTYCDPIFWDEALPGDLVFYPEDSHVGIVGGRGESGDLLIIHCAFSANNVVITGLEGFTSIGRPHYYGN